MKAKYMAVVVLTLLLIGAGTASAKSLYVNKDLNANSPISAYDIQVNNLVWQQTSVPTRYGGAGLAIDTDSETLFVTFEFSGTLDIVNAKTLAKLGQVSAPGASNLAGIVVDQDKQKVYTSNRESSYIYIYSWNAATKTLTLDNTQSLVGAYKIYGLALDEKNDILYVGDLTTTVKGYDTNSWGLVKSLPVSQSVMGIAVDEVRGYVYTGNAYPGYGSLGLLSQYDLNSNSEKTVNTRALSGGVSTDNAVGVAVDLDTGLVYVTTGNQASGGSDRILVLDSNLNLKSATGDIGNPTGIVVPRTQISYNPLNLVKTDGVTTVYQGGQLTYSISFDNLANPNQVTGVTLKDVLPQEVAYVSCTGGGSYDSGAHAVNWNIGTLAPNAPSQTVTVTVDVGPTAPIGTVLDNFVTVNGNEEGTGPTTVHDRDTEIVAQGGEIPEFPTVAIPMAAILGLAFVFQRRKD